MVDVSNLIEIAFGVGALSAAYVVYALEYKRYSKNLKSREMRCQEIE